MVVDYFQRRGAAALSTARQLAADQAGQPFSSIGERYDLLTRYYHNEMYDVVNGVAQAAKSQGGLYRNIRPINNPIRRAVDWYPGHVYPGVMTMDGLPLADGTPSCVPFSADDPEEVRLAMMQAMQWANWGAERWAFVRGLGMLGDSFGEIEIDYERGKAYPKFHHPGRVVNIEWNGSGDVVLYRLEIPMYDPDAKKNYRWGKEVDREKITTFYDDKKHGYDDQDAEMENIFGFVYGAWGQFRNIGGQHGASISDGVRSKIDEINNVLSPIMDFIGKFVNQGVIIAAPGGKKAFEEAMGLRSTGGATADRTNPQGGRQEVPYVFVPPGTTFFKALENLGLGEAVEHVNGLVHEIEKDLPETTMDEQLRQIPQVTGPGAERMMGDVRNRLSEVIGNSDHMITKLMQMDVSINGHLVRNGFFGKQSALTDQQKKFLPFSLESYERGELDVSLAPRPLFPTTQMERIQAAVALQALETPFAMQAAGLSLDDIYGEGQAPERVPGLLEQRQSASSGLSDLLGRALNTGQG